MIYCVEDERNIRELLVYTLHSTGFEANYSTNSGRDRTEYKKKSSIFNLVDRI